MRTRSSAPPAGGKAKRVSSRTGSNTIGCASPNVSGCSSSGVIGTVGRMGSGLNTATMEPHILKGLYRCSGHQLGGMNGHAHGELLGDVGHVRGIAAPRALHRLARDEVGGTNADVRQLCELLRRGGEVRPVQIAPRLEWRYLSRLSRRERVIVQPEAWLG